jgi:calmodulin-regulated spectrin-associated protein
LEQYQQSIALMNCDLHDIQDDIQKLAKQQNQIQVQAMQAQQLFQAQQIANILNQQYSSQQNIAGLYHPIQQQYGSTPHLPMKPPHHQYVNDQGQYINQQIYSRENSRIIDDQYAVSSPPTQYLNQEKQRNIAKYVQETNNYRDQFDTQQAQFFLHQEPQTPPQPPARRTWSQKAPTEMSSWSQQAQIQQHQMFQQQQHQHQMQQQQQHQLQQQQPQQQSWKSSSSSASQSEKGFVLHQNGKISQESQAHRLFPVQHAANQQNPPLRKVPPEEVMAPQSISFIGEEEDGNDDEPDNFNHSSRMDDLEVSLGKLNITSGSRTYRIPSPTTRNHPGLAVNSFQSIESQNDENEKGFYISFDGDTQPKRPKPPLRTKRSPKKRPVDEPVQESKNLSHQDMNNYYDDSPFKPTPDERLKQVITSPIPQVKMVNKSKESEALIIGDEQTSSERVNYILKHVSHEF